MSSSRQVVVFHPGTQHSWQTARALQELGRLEFYATSILYRRGEWPYVLERLPGPVGRGLKQEFRRFEAPALDPRLVRTRGLHEWLERLANRAGMAALARKFDRWGNRSFHKMLVPTLETRPVILWGYSGSSLETFAHAKRHGRTCILDRTVGDFRYYNHVIAEQVEAYPSFFTKSRQAFDEYTIARDDREYELADRIVVGSEFCRQTLLAHSPVPGLAEKTSVLPYAFDAGRFSSVPDPRPVARDGPVKFLFLGRVEPRKGIHLLLEAITRLSASEAELTVVGNVLIPPATFARYADRITHRATVARSEVPRIMAEHHVLVLPSFLEGSAISLLEALASGMAVIQSRAAGNGATTDTGLVLDEPSVDSLVEAMRVPIDDRDRLDHWRSNARLAAQSYSHETYRDGILRLLKSLDA